MHVLLKILDKVESRLPTFRRSLTYEIANTAPGLRATRVDSMVVDMALTIDVHPYCLGIKPESKSQVYVPENMQLVLHEVDSIFDFAETRRTDARTLVHGSWPIPAMISRLQVQNLGQETRAVVVTEHRNIKAYTQHISGSTALPGLDGIILIMLGGYADYAAREFLCLLYKDSTMTRVPFLWVSDCDADGIQNFAQCKYGSRTAAFASPIMVCPALEYAGMALSMFEEAVKKAPGRQLQHTKRQKTNLSAAETAALKKDYEATAAKKKAVVLGRKRTAANQERTVSILNALERAAFGSGTDRIALECLQALVDGQASLPMTCVNEVDNHGILYVVRDTVAAARGEEYEDVAVMMLCDSLRQAFDAHGS